MMEGMEAVRARIAAIQGRFGMESPAAAVPAQEGAFAQALASGIDASPLRPFGPEQGQGASAFEPMIAQAAQRNNVDPALLRSVMRAESGFNPRAVSRTGAQGLMQLMPSTSRALGVADPFDPAQNVDGGARYLRHLLDKFGDTRLAVAAYNAGPGAVEKYGGIPPFAETQSYVQRVMDGLGTAPAVEEQGIGR